MEPQLIARLQKFNSYSMYKESGVSYLGQIPIHWKVQKDAKENSDEVNTAILMYLRTYLPDVDKSDVFTVVPPLEEQKEIVSFLNQKIENVLKLQVKIADPLIQKKLQEYLKILIKNVITGKIDIRGLER